MFQLLPNDPKVPDVSKMNQSRPCFRILTSYLRKWEKKICHEGKPVAVREKLFKILTIAHKQCQHGGRDKTSAQVRRIYSWCVDGTVGPFVLLKTALSPLSVHSVAVFFTYITSKIPLNFANESHSLGSQKSSYPVSSSCAPPARRGEEHLAHPPLFRTKTLPRTTWTYNRHRKCCLHMNRAEATLAADSAR
jgi:hypothetical protein